MPQPPLSEQLESLVLRIGEEIRVLRGSQNGSPGSTAHIHTQDTPMATWTISHGLGRHPHAVRVIEDSGQQVIASVEDPDVSTTVITHAVPMTGTAILL